MQPLTAGTKYCLSFYASSGARNISGSNYVAVDEIGASFTASQPFDSIASVLHLPYQVRSPGGVFMTDTNQWYPVSGTFTATGGEEADHGLL